MNTKKWSACLWTGGKDCCLALHRAATQGYDIRCLVTFAPPQPSFLAHPIAVMQAQAAALGLPHRLVQLDGPMEQAYRGAIAQLRREGIATLITGDIDLVGGMPNWIRQCCEGLDMQVHMPLWQQDRLALMREMVSGRHEVVLSLVKRPWLDESYAGQVIDQALLAEFEAISARGSGNGDRRRQAATASDFGIATAGTGASAKLPASEPVPLDLCGENGEYHTMVLNAPMFEQRVAIEFDKATKGEMTYLEIRRVELVEKPEA